MAHLEIETAVARHPKFQQAGPHAAWLWLCGLCYCQDGLTDGFIHQSALRFLGVLEPEALAQRLEEAGLWERTDDGWQVHDYLAHNRSAAEVEQMKHRNRVSGARGGQESARLRGEKAKLRAEAPPSKRALKHGAKAPRPSAPLQHTAEAPVEPRSDQYRSDQISTDQSTPLPPEPDDWRSTARPLDEAFLAFQAQYPEARRKGGALVEREYFGAVMRAGGPDVLDRALVGHIASAQWVDPALIPGMDRWLREDYWRQTMTPASDRTRGRGVTGAAPAGKYDHAEMH